MTKDGRRVTVSRSGRRRDVAAACTRCATLRTGQTRNPLPPLHCKKKKNFFFSDSQDLALRHSKLYSYFIRNYRNLHNSNWHYLSLTHCIIGPVIQGKRGFNELCLLLKRKWKRVEQINPWPNREYYAMQLMKARSAWGLSTWGRGHQRHTEDAVNCPFWTTRNPQEEFFL